MTTGQYPEAIYRGFWDMTPDHFMNATSGISPLALR